MAAATESAVRLEILPGGGKQADRLLPPQWNKFVRNALVFLLSLSIAPACDLVSELLARLETRKICIDIIVPPHRTSCSWDYRSPRVIIVPAINSCRDKSLPTKQLAASLRSILN